MRRIARALAASAALACLLFSDGVGPRLVPYPEEPARGERPHEAREQRPQVSTDHNPHRERALIALGVKLNALKHDKAAGGGPDQAGRISGALALRPAAHQLARRPSDKQRPASHSFYSTTRASHRGPPYLS